MYSFMGHEILVISYIHVRLLHLISEPPQTRTQLHLCYSYISHHITITADAEDTAGKALELNRLEV